MALLSYFQRRKMPGADVCLLALGMVLLMCSSLRILYVRNVSELLIYAISFICFVTYVIMNFRKVERFTSFAAISSLLIFIIYLYERIALGNVKVLSLFGMMTSILGGVLIIQATLREKRSIYNAFQYTIAIMLSVALIFWILYLIGFPLPHYSDNSDPFYKYEMYPFFNVVVGVNAMEILTRFAGPFLEPGHNATICVFLLFINGFRLKDPVNIVLLLSVLFSLSLAGYGLLIGAVILYMLYKKRILSMLLMISVFLGVGIGSAYYLKGENPVYEIVFSRLEMNENGDDIVGNNRTSMVFDLNYAKFLKSDKIWTGMGKRAFGSKEDGSDNVTIGSAGVKRYIFIRGYIGLALILIFILYYWAHYRSLSTFGFLVIYIVANLIRDYPTKEMWMYIFLMGMPLLYYQVLSHKRKIGSNSADSVLSKSVEIS